LWLETISIRITKEVTEECETTIEAALTLVTNLFNKKMQYCMDLLKMAITVLLLSLAKVNPEKRELLKVCSLTQNTLQAWIARRDVIGGSSFGCGSAKKGHEELKLWESLLSVRTPEDDDIRKSWTKVVSAVIRKRIEETPVKMRLSLVPIIKDDTHSVLSSALMNGGIQAIDRISSEPDKYSNESRNLDGFVTLESKKVGLLFAHLIERKYPEIHREKEISLKELLTWPHWPSFIRIHNGRSVLKEGLPHHCRRACLLATSKLVEVLRKLKTGDISVMDMQEIKTAHAEMKRLCETTEGKTEGIQYDECLKQRLEEYAAFQQQKYCLLHLCQRIFEVAGTKAAVDELRKDYSSFEINKLCVCRGADVEILCFSAASPLLSFAWMFHVMTKKVNSSIFDSTWRSIMLHATSSNPKLALTDLEGAVWTPTIIHCQNLLKTMKERSITLRDIDKYFDASGDEIEQELKALCLGVAMCRKEVYDDHWINAGVALIVEYRKLRQYHAAATLFLELRTILNLTQGDFHDVERIAKEVSVKL
jgi:hypothetical protein